MAEKDEGGRADSKLSRFKGGMFLAAVAGTGLLAGFSTTLGMTKKKSPDMFDKGVAGGPGIESGVSVGLRALKWGTFYAVVGVGSLAFLTFKILGVSNLAEFRTEMQQKLPRIPKARTKNRVDNLDSLFGIENDTTEAER
ncbi:transmembrane protein 242-like [Branchiostoma floridae x Branchiostoma japonicum]